MSAINFLTAVAETPAETAAGIFSERKVRAGTGCIFLASLSFFLWLYLAGFPFSLMSGGILFFLIFFLILFKFAVLVSILHFLLEMTGASGTAAGLFAVMGTASLVWTFLIPFGLIFRLSFPGNFFPQALVFLFLFLYFIWLAVHAIKNNYRVPGWKSWFIMAVPFVLPVILGMLFVFGMIFWALSSFF